MISCDHTKSLFSDYIENSLNADALQSVNHHLERCPDCRQVFNNLQFLNARLKTVRQVKTSADFDRNLRQRILSQGQEEKPLITVRGFSFGFSGAAVIAAATFLVFNTFAPKENATHSVPPAGITTPVSRSAPPVMVQNPVVAHKNNEENLVPKDSIKQIPVSVDQNKIKLAEQEK